MQYLKSRIARILRRRSSSTSKSSPMLLRKVAFSENQFKGIHGAIESVNGIRHGNTTVHVMIVWFEPTFFVRDDYQEIFRKLNKEYENLVFVFTNVDEWKESLTAIDMDTKIYLIMPGMWTMELLKHFKRLSTIREIFVYSSSPKEYQFLTQKNPAVRKIYGSIDDVCNGMRQYLDKRCEVLRFYDQRTVRELSREEDIGEFIWFMAFKDALFRLPYDEKGKDEMIDVCQDFYATNPAQLRLIDEFKSSYVSDDAFKWFSRNSFLYRLVNRALRTQDVEQLYVFRYYIRDLSSWLSHGFPEMIACKQNFFLYRGAALAQEDIALLDVGKLLAPNGFFSTSRDIDVAKLFIGSDRADTIGVLYKIQCNLTSYSHEEIESLVPFADLSENSCIPDEKEVLFDLGATFEIENIEYPSKGRDYLIIHLIPSCEGGHLLRDYREQYQSKMDDSSPALIFGDLLLRTGKHLAAQHYFEQLLNDSNDENISAIHHYLGWTHMRRGDYGQATIHFDQAHDAIPQSDSTARARILNSIGKALAEKGRIKESLSYYLRALHLRKSSLGSKHEDVADSYANVARVYNLAGNEKLARKYYKKSLQTNTYAADSFQPSNYEEMREESGSMVCSWSSDDSFNELHHSSNYGSVSSSFYELGSLQWQMGRSASGLHNMKQSLTIDKHSSPPGTSDLLRSFHSYGNVSPIGDPKVKEVTYRLCCLENTQRRHSKTNDDEAKDLEKVGSAYAASEDFHQALKYYLSALQLREKQGRTFKYSLNTARTLNDIGNTYHALHQTNEALNYYRRALAIYERFPSEANQDRLRTINKINQIAAKNEVSKAGEHSQCRRVSSSAPLARKSKTTETFF